MNFNIMNNNFNIKEFDYSTEPKKLKKFKEHLNSMKEIICKRRETLTKEPSNIKPSFIMDRLRDLKIDQCFFCFAIYQRVNIFHKQKERPTAILFARNGSKNDSYILKLICTHEQTIKGFGKLLMDKLVNKATENDIKSIFVESTSNSELFYKKNEFDTESDKELYTESDKDPELQGYVLEVSKYQTGGTISSDDKYYFNVYCKYNSIYTFELIKDNKITSKLEARKQSHSQYSYASLEIEKIEGSNKELLLLILDNISKNHYIWKTYIHGVTEEENELFEKQNYLHKNKKLPWKYYEKIHNNPVYIDRTILSYNNYN